MKRQVITIGPMGQMSGLQVKPGQGVDLRQFGKAKITRVSLIEWSEDHQMWYVNVLQEAGKGMLTLADFADALGLTEKVPNTPVLDGIAPSGWATNDDGHLLFDEYPEAVAAEIAYLDALRAKGVH